MRTPTVQELILVSCPPWSPEMPNLSLAYLAEAARAGGWRCDQLDLNLELFLRAGPRRRLTWEMGYSEFWWRVDPIANALNESDADHVQSELETLATRRPAAVGFTLHNLNLPFVMEGVQRLRWLGYEGLIVVGGPAVLEPSAGSGALRLLGYPLPELEPAEAARRLEAFGDAVDALVFREGEVTLVELLRRYADGGRAALQGTTGALLPEGDAAPPLCPRPQVADLDTLPWPTFAEADVARYTEPILPVLLSRGCPRSCNMCFQRALWPGYRHRSPQQIVAELTHHVRRLGIHEFHTYDQSTNGSPRFFEALCDAIIAAPELKIELTGNVIVHPEMTPALLGKMARAGFRSLIIGVESGAPDTLARMGKGFTVAEAERMLADAADAGLRNNINMLVGFPGETEEEFQQTLAFVRRNRELLDRVTLAGTTHIYPETPLAERPEAFGVEPGSVSSFGMVSACPYWRGADGLDQAERMARCRRLCRELDALGVDKEHDPEMDSVPEQAPDHVQRTLVEGDLFAREALARSGLDQVTDPAVVPALRAALDDPSALVRGRACMALTRLAPDEASEHAVEWLQAGPAVERRLAAMALARIGGDLALAHLERPLSAGTYASLDWELQHELQPLRRWIALLELVEEPGPDAPYIVRLRALEANDERAFDSPEAEALLSRALTHPVPLVCKLAARLLARLPHARAVPLALRSLDAPHGAVRNSAAIVLARAGGDRAFERLEPLLAGDYTEPLKPELDAALAPLRHWYGPVETLAERGPGALEPGVLRRLLGPAAPAWIRLRVVQAAAGHTGWLRAVGRHVDVDALLRRGLEHPVPAVVHAAIKAQVALGGPSARRRLRHFLSEAQRGDLPEAWQHTLAPLLDRPRATG